MKTRFSSDEARRIAVTAQRLNEPETEECSPIAVTEIIQQLGYLQIDTISVVARTHEHTLWARTPAFLPEMLYGALRDDRSVFEYWAHAMSYLPMKDYRYFLPLMRSFHQPDGNWAKNRYEKYGHLLEPVLQRVKEEGPIRSRDFTPQKSDAPKTWWDWRPEKIVLELLLWRGDLMVKERQGFQKVYDLTERVLPAWVDTTYPTDEEIGSYVVKQTLTAYGIANEKDMRGFFHEVKNDTVKIGLEKMQADGEIRAVEIESNPGQVYYVLANGVDLAGKVPEAVHILSPFDNLIIQRKRVSQIFDFQYSLECYLPAPKRVYGYYVMPILYGSNLVGRMDPKAERKKKTFIIRSLYFEESFQPDDRFLALFAQKIGVMMQFNDCERLSIENIFMEKVSEPMFQAFRKINIEPQAIQ